MILPVYLYGSPVLRKKAESISPGYPRLREIIENLFETTYHSDGIGMAAPQVGISIRLFVVDTSRIESDEPLLKDFKKVFINPEIISYEGEKVVYNEGCLSIPGIREDVERETRITIRYQDEDFNEHEEQFEGYPARIIQHEYDHLEGRLFTDLLSPLRRRLLKSKLNAISKGKVDTTYRVKNVR